MPRARSKISGPSRPEPRRVPGHSDSSLRTWTMPSRRGRKPAPAAGVSPGPDPEPRPAWRVATGLRKGTAELLSGGAQCREYPVALPAYPRCGRRGGVHELPQSPPDAALSGSVRESSPVGVWTGSAVGDAPRQSLDSPGSLLGNAGRSVLPHFATRSSPTPEPASDASVRSFPNAARATGGFLRGCSGWGDPKLNAEVAL